MSVCTWVTRLGPQVAGVAALIDGRLAGLAEVAKAVPVRTSRQGKHALRFLLACGQCIGLQSGMHNQHAPCCSSSGMFGVWAGLCGCSANAARNAPQQNATCNLCMHTLNASIHVHTNVHINRQAPSCACVQPLSTTLGSLARYTLVQHLSITATTCASASQPTHTWSTSAPAV